MSEPFLVHKTHVQAFVECPRRLKFLLENVPTEVTVCMQIGDLFHRFARYFFEVADPKMKDLKSLVPQTYPPIVQELCLRFVEWETQRLARMRKEGTSHLWKPIAMEVYLENREEGIAGTIDRIDELPSGNVAIVEYKTGRPVVSAVRRELGLYALLAKPYYPVELVAMFNPNKQYAYVQKVDDRLLRKARLLVLAVRRAIESGNFPRNEDHWCITCPYLSVCFDLGE